MGKVDGKWVIENIKKRTRGEMSDEHWAEFQALLNSISGSYDCANCSDTGYVHKELSERALETLFICRCPKGQKMAESPIYEPRDKEKTTPVVIPRDYANCTKPVDHSKRLPYKDD